MDRKGRGHVAAAAVLSVLFPGAGQAYNGELGMGIGFGLAYIALPLALLFYGMRGPEWGIHWVRIVPKVFLLASVVQAAVRASQLPSDERAAPREAWKAGLAFLMLGWIANAGINRLGTSLILRDEKSRFQEDERRFQHDSDRLNAKLAEIERAHSGDKWLKGSIKAADLPDERRSK
jgi:hypothetical protein